MSADCFFDVLKIADTEKMDTYRQRVQANVTDLNHRHNR